MEEILSLPDIGGMLVSMLSIDAISNFRLTSKKCRDIIDRESNLHGIRAVHLPHLFSIDRILKRFILAFDASGIGREHAITIASYAAKNLNLSMSIMSAIYYPDGGLIYDQLRSDQHQYGREGVLWLAPFPTNKKACSQIIETMYNITDASKMILYGPLENATRVVTDLLFKDSMSLGIMSFLVKTGQPIEHKFASLLSLDPKSIANIREHGDADSYREGAIAMFSKFISSATDKDPISRLLF